MFAWDNRDTQFTCYGQPYVTMTPRTITFQAPILSYSNNWEWESQGGPRNRAERFAAEKLGLDRINKIRRGLRRLLSTEHKKISAAELEMEVWRLARRGHERTWASAGPRSPQVRGRRGRRPSGQDRRIRTCSARWVPVRA